MRYVIGIAAILGIGTTLYLGLGTSGRPSDEAFPEEVTYPAGKETLHGIMFRRHGAEPLPAVVLIHGDFGLDDTIKGIAKLELGDKGFATLVVDLYRGQKVDSLLDAHIMDRGLPENQVLGDLRAAVDYLVTRPDIRHESIGVVGLDMGGGYALDAAIHDPRIKAVVTCYGRLTTDPVLLKPLNASVLGIFAGKDEGISMQTIEQFCNAMQNAGKEVAGLHVYPQAEHGFLNPIITNSSPPPPGEKSPAVDALEKIQLYLRKTLGTSAAHR